MTKRNYQTMTHFVIWICAVLMSLPPGFVPGALAQECLDIADIPIAQETVGGNANVFLLLDDSGSMDWEVVAEDPYADSMGAIAIGTAANDVDYAYLYNTNGQVGGNFYETNRAEGAVLGATTGSRAQWRATFSGFNKMYYNPRTHYKPWVNYDGSSLPNADVNTPRLRPAVGAFTGAATMSLNTPWLSFGDSATSTWQGIIRWYVEGENHGLTYVSDIGAWTSVNPGSINDRLFYDNDYVPFFYCTEANASITFFVDVDSIESDPAFGNDAYMLQGWIPCYNGATAADTDVRVTLQDLHRQNASQPYANDGAAQTYTWNQSAGAGNCGQWVTLFSGLNYGNNDAANITLSRTANTGIGLIIEGFRFVTQAQLTAEAAAQAAPPPDPFTIPIAHYYVHDDTNGNKVYDYGERVFLVILNQDNTVTYYRVTLPAPNGENDFFITEAMLTEVTDVTDTGVLPASCYAEAFRSPLDYEGPADLSPRQNFANWFQYHRRRWMTSVYAMTAAIQEFSGVNVGIGGLNAMCQDNNTNLGILEPIRLVPAGFQGLYTALFNFDFIAGQYMTPLRSGYENVGHYFERGVHCDRCEAGGLGTVEPISDDAGKCALNFVIVFTDGFWTGGSAGTSNEDGEDVWVDSEGYRTTTAPALGGHQISGCLPFEDDRPQGVNTTNTFADVVMKYYNRDLAPTVANEVPTWDGIPPDYVPWQHLVTYVIGFGVTGTLPYKTSQEIYSDLVANTPPWPNVNTDQKKVDDNWHAAVNGRGEYFPASNPEELVEAMLDLIGRINDRIGTGARATANSTQLTSNTELYSVGYDGKGWLGTLVAKDVTVDQTTLEISTVDRWAAHTLLNTRVEPDDGYADREIATYTGSTGTAFTWAGIGSDHQTALTSGYAALDGGSGRTGTDLVNYLRGQKTNEVRNSGIFRNRMNEDNVVFTLGDIVHSSATFDSDMLYVGANDGMLHAFSVASGEEVFAYVPSFVVGNMKLLSHPDYDHKFFVDETPVVRNTGTVTLLVGGLGKGGKGIYCLDVTNPSANTESNAGGSDGWVKWEFPNTQTAAHIPDMGYTFGQPYIVKTQRADQPWVVIFANGYVSPNEHAVLFVVDAFDGSYITKLDTGVGGCNGLSNIIVTDPDANNIADYVYAGDLKGKLWKFDLTSPDPLLWDVAYKNGSSPEPLFTTKGPDGNPQPITAKPDVMEHCDPTMPGYIVVFGTGKYLGLTDIGNGADAGRANTVYGVWDYGDDIDDAEYLGAFDRGTLEVSSGEVSSGLAMLEQAPTVTTDPGTGAIDGIIAACNDTCWKAVPDLDGNGQADNPDTSDTACGTTPSYAGWFMDLPMDGERVAFDIMILEGSAYILTVAPEVSGEPCASGGRSGVYIVNACSGSCNLRVNQAGYTGADTYDFDVSGVDTDGDGIPDVYDRDSNQITLTGPDPSNPTTSTTTPTSAPNVTLTGAGVGGTMLFDPATGQFVYIVTEQDGTIRQPVRTAAEKIGLIYWRVVD